jgi:hypothetical protein
MKAADTKSGAVCAGGKEAVKKGLIGFRGLTSA